MDFKIIWWMIAAFNSTFNGNGMVNHNQALATNSNTHPVASSSRFSDVVQTHGPDRIAGWDGLTEDELQKAEAYKAFIVEHIDPDAVVTPQDMYAHAMSHRSSKTPIEPLFFPRIGGNQPISQTGEQRKSGTELEQYCDLLKEPSVHRREFITASYSKMQFHFKFDEQFSDDEIKRMMECMQEVVDKYEPSFGAVPTFSAYIHKWTQPRGNVYGQHQRCRSSPKEENHLLQFFLSEVLPHAPGHEMGHALHDAHTRGAYIPSLIGDGIAEYVSLPSDRCLLMDNVMLRKKHLTCFAITRPLQH